MRPLNTREWLESVHPVSQYYDFAREALAAMARDETDERRWDNVFEALWPLGEIGDSDEAVARIERLVLFQRGVTNLMVEAGLLETVLSADTADVPALLRMFLPVED